MPVVQRAHNSRQMTLLLAGARAGLLVLAAPALLPLWPPTWSLQRSTIAMPANESGYLDVGLASKFGVISIDWSNSKAEWASATPMSDEELLLKQAGEIKAASGGQTKVFIYRNLVKALPWWDAPLPPRHVPHPRCASPAS